MLLAKSFFGFDPDSVFDYILIYSICIILIVVGLFILAQIKRGEKPATPEKMERYCEKLLHLFDVTVSDIENPKATTIKISNDIMKMELLLNKIVYSCTVVIEENRDITFEGLRSSLQFAIRYLDDGNASALKKDKQKEFILKAKELVAAVASTLEEINARYAKFGN